MENRILMFVNKIREKIIQNKKDSNKKQKFKLKKPVIKNKKRS